MAFPTSTALTKHLLTGVATTALSLGLVASASAQNSTLAPTFGDTVQSQGFGSTSITIQAGGDIDATNFGGCSGFIADAPDYAIDYNGQFGLQIEASSNEDTTIVVEMPDGGIFCNDDFSGLNPGVQMVGNEPGRYAIWVGTFNAIANNTYPDADIIISEITGPTPRPTPTPTPTPSAGLDRFALPAFGTIAVTSGFGTQSFDMQAGGDVDAYAFDNRCAGYVASVPDYVIEYQGQAGSSLDISATSGDDTTLLVMDPNGNVFCNDDANGTLDPALSISNPSAGDYAVWVGTFSSAGGNNFPEAVLTVSSNAAGTTPPRPTPTTGSFDTSSAATFGSVNLGSDLSAGHSITLQAGGNIDAFNVNQACNGWVADVPDYVISYAGGRTPMTIGVESDADTTLVVITPDGQVLCNDDDIDLNPGITVNNPGPGDYTVYVGTYLPIENDFYPDALLSVSGGQQGRPLTPPVNPGNPGNFNQRALQTPTFGSVNLANGFANHAVDLQAGGALEGFEFGGSCNGYVADAPDYIINYGGGSDLQISATSQDDTTMTVITPSGEVLCNDDFGDLNPGMFINDAGAGSYAVWVGTYLPIENDVYPNATLSVSEVSDNKVQPSGAITSTSLTAGFTPDPFTTVLAAGGPIDAGSIDGACNGFIASEPDFRLNYTSGDWPLRVYVQSDSDTTLLMRTPSGEVMCNDDFDGLNPSLSLADPASGTYEVFIGTYDPTGGNPNATLAVTELLDQKDLPPGAVVEANVNPGMAREDYELLAGGSFLAFETLDQACGGYIASEPDFLAFVALDNIDIEMTVRSAEDTTLAVRTPTGQFICDDDAGGDFNPLITLLSATPGAYEIWLGTFSSVGHAPATLSIRDLNAGSTTAPNVPGGGKK